MNRLVVLFLIFVFGCSSAKELHKVTDVSEISKIEEAKRIVLSQLIFPDSAEFHENKTEVNGNNVKIVVTSKDLSGLVSTRSFDVNLK
jgi:hypothetical protein